MNSEENGADVVRTWFKVADSDLERTLDAFIEKDAVLFRVKQEAELRRRRRAAAAVMSGGPSAWHAAGEVGRFVRRRSGEWLGSLDVSEGTGLMPTLVYPVILQFVAAGWLEERWEDSHSSDAPRRKLYRLAPEAGPAITDIVLEAEARSSTADSESAGRKRAHDPREAW